MSDQRYCEIAMGLVSNRGLAIPVAQLGAHVVRARELGQELYRSWYTFDEGLVEHLQKYKTIRLYKGMVYLDRITFDIDKGKNTDQTVLDHARMFAEMLSEDWIDDPVNIQCWYSGTGYHIVIPDIFGFEPSPTLPETVRATLTKHFPAADDIYDRPRFIRVGGTVNLKSGLHKIPLTFEELFKLGVVQIRELAKVPRVGFRFEPFTAIDKIAAEHIIQHREQITGHTVPETKPTQMVSCMQKVWNEGDVRGSRHQNLLRLASAWRKAGLPQSACEILGRSWAPSLEQPEVNRIVNDVFLKGYAYSCSDPIMQKYCDPKCVFHKKKDYVLEVADAKKMERDFVQFVRTDFSNTSFDLAEVFDVPEYQFMPGEVVILIGDTKLGKTAWLQNLVVRLTRMRSLYLSLEVHQNLIYRRFVQIAHKMSKKQIIQHYMANENRLSNAIGHIQCITTAPTLPAIRQLIAYNQPHIVVVDTVDAIEIDNIRDPVAKSDAIGRGLKEIAQQANVIIMGIQHVTKSAVSADIKTGRKRPLDIHSGKGASTLEQKADKVIAIEGNRLDNLRRIHSLGARDESGFDMWCRMSPDTFIFEQLQGGLPLLPGGTTT